MAKYYGVIGFSESVETAPSVFEEHITEREYFGDILSNTVRWQNGVSLNDNLNISNRISVVADSFLNENFSNMRYVTFMGDKWKISSAEIAYPRVILTIGGVYNEPESS